MLIQHNSYNIKTASTDSTTVAETIYSELIEPAFDNAVRDDKLKSKPTLIEICDAAHKLPLGAAAAQAGNLTPPIQFRFRSQYLKDIFFLYSKDIIKNLNKKPENKGEKNSEWPRT